MQATLQYAGHIALAALCYADHIATCRKATSSNVWYRRRVVHFRVHFNVPYQRLCVVQTAGRVTFVYISTCHTSSSVSHTRRVVSLLCIFQRAVLAALHGKYDGWCHFHCTVQAALCGAGVCLCLFLLLKIVYLAIYVQLGLVVGMTKQMSDGKEVDIVNC